MLLSARRTRTPRLLYCYILDPREVQLINVDKLKFAGLVLYEKNY